jgi:hypothetical protein
MTNIIPLCTRASRHDEATDGLVAIAVGIRAAAQKVSVLPLAPGRRLLAISALIEAVQLVQQAAEVLEGSPLPGGAGAGQMPAQTCASEPT